MEVRSCHCSRIFFDRATNRTENRQELIRRRLSWFRSLSRALGMHLPLYECNAGKNSIMIDSNSDLYPCENAKRYDWLLGNLKNETLEDIIRSPRMVDLRQLLHGKAQDCQQKCVLGYYCSCMFPCISSRSYCALANGLLTKSLYGGKGVNQSFGTIRNGTLNR